MDSRVSLGLKLLLKGKVVLLEGPGHPPILEAMIKAWQEATIETITLTREGRTQEFYSAGGTWFHQDMIQFWQGDLFEQKAKLGESARSVALLALSHLGIELPNPHRKEAIRLLLRERIDTLSSSSRAEIRPRYCALLGVEAVGTLRDRYGDDMASLVGYNGISIETP